MSGWYLEQISIEGFRGINNEGSPLTLNFKSNKVNSVSAPNGVGKTSVYDALLYAITGKIPKLDNLPAIEKGHSYYLNKFHGSGIGTIVLTLAPTGGGQSVSLTITRDSLGTRTVSASGAADGNAILESLNREFVLLDGRTFQDFIDVAPLQRGRSFSGLLGLRRFAALRQGLTALTNTRAFNNHFGTKQKGDRLSAINSDSQRVAVQIKDAYQRLVGEPMGLHQSDFLTNAHEALCGIELLKPLCQGKEFTEIDADACIEAAKAAEGGSDRVRLSEILQTESAWAEAVASIPQQEDQKRLIALAEARDDAFAKTRGELFHQLYELTNKIAGQDTWPDKHTCPACERSGENSISNLMDTKIAEYDTAAQAAEELASEWVSKAWSRVIGLEKLSLREDEIAIVQTINAGANAGSIDAETARRIVSWIATMNVRANSSMEKLEQERVVLEKSLPPKLTAVVEKVEAARRLQTSVLEWRKICSERNSIREDLDRIERVRKFLSDGHSQFSSAESAAATRRLEAIEPKCQEIFAQIMHEDVVPALRRRTGGAELEISLADFWSLKDVSPQAVLSESYRNAFAISVYLAAASLYGGDAKFLVLDDVTSSFDSGHQYHIINIIKDQFARPGTPNGPQVIILSHDVALEKLFNTLVGTGAWWHQRIQGNTLTSVLPQSGAVDQIRNATIAHLNAGNVDFAAPRIRQYLEFKLEEIITKVGIPVPIAIAFNDDKHMAKNLIDAIKAAVDLHAAAARLVLEPAQVNGLGTALTTIVSNYLAHWSTGQAGAFTAGSLKGVMRAIDDFARCFQFADPAGSGQYRYYKSLSQRS